MTLSLENRCLVLFEAIAISSRGYDSNQKWIGSVYDISAGQDSRRVTTNEECFAEGEFILRHRQR